MLCALFGTFASHLPQGYSIDTAFVLLSYFFAFIVALFYLWVFTRAKLTNKQLILGSVFAGLGVSGMHYLGMFGLMNERYQVIYSPVKVAASVLVSILGSYLVFYLFFKYKQIYRKKRGLKLILSIIIALNMVGMHYLGMNAMSFVATLSDHHLIHNSHQGLLIFSAIFVASLLFVAGFCVAVLEFKLEEKDQALSELNQELAGISIKDSLTQLPNRLFLNDYAEMMFSYQSLKNQKFAFLCIDLDHFKSVNDAFGHHVGDQLLIQLSQRIRAYLSEKTQFLRMGGDEFLVIFEYHVIPEINRLSEELLKLVQKPYFVLDKEINLSASIGISLYPEHGKNLQDLLANVDAAMLLSQEQGRNTYTLYNQSCALSDAKAQSTLINDLYKAVEEQQFILFYQPKFTIDQKICGVEALIRWKHPTLGLLMPYSFIEGAEKTGLIVPMGYWALEQACKQIQHWVSVGIHFYPIAVNLSALQFENKQLFENLEYLIQKYNIQKNQLIVEVTESIAMRHIETSIQTFERLRKLGIRIAIDDFGTGHSSFLYLKDLPVDELKIDRGFIVDLMPDSKEEMILESIIQLATKLGLSVTAEGVETPQQVEILTRLGCHQLQGYLLGMPVPVERLSTYQQVDYFA